MKKAITTKYLPYTDTKPSRIKAFDGDGHSVIISYDSNEPTTATRGDTRLDEIERRHRLAAVKLCEKMGWDHIHLVGGGTGKGYVWVWDDDGVRAAVLKEIAHNLEDNHLRRQYGVVDLVYDLAKANAPKGP